MITIDGYTWGVLGEVYQRPRRRAGDGRDRPARGAAVGVVARLLPHAAGLDHPASRCSRSAPRARARCPLGRRAARARRPDGGHRDGRDQQRLLHRRRRRCWLAGSVAVAAAIARMSDEDFARGGPAGRRCLAQIPDERHMRAGGTPGRVTRGSPRSRWRAVSRPGRTVPPGEDQDDRWMLGVAMALACLALFAAPHRRSAVILPPGFQQNRRSAG